MLTIFSIPKPFLGHIGVIQRNALRSWTRLADTQVVLFGDEEGVAAAAAEMGAAHVPDVERNAFGTPYLSHVFEAAAEIGSRNLCYANADIILPAEFGADVATVAQQKRRFLMVGRCRDVDIRADLSPDEAFLLPGDDRSHLAIDYFAFPRSVHWALPPFVVGRGGWDNWMLHRARSRRIPLVDASERAIVLHQLHDYSHIPQSTGKTWGGPETDANRSLFGKPKKKRRFTLLDATYVLTREGRVVRAAHARGWGRIRAEKRVWAATVPWHLALRYGNDLRHSPKRLRAKLALRTRVRRLFLS